jgi:hypothetical protein
MLKLISFFVILYVKTHGSNSNSFVTATFVMAMDKNLIAAIVVAQQLFASYFMFFGDIPNIYEQKSRKKREQELQTQCFS